MASSSRLSFSRSISSTSSSSHLLPFLLCFFTFFSYSLQDIDVCKTVDCGQGHCVPGLLPSCQCNPGWKTIMIGPMAVGACIVPNCTLDLTCGSGTPAPPPPPPAPLNFSDPCNLVWCWNGYCVPNGAGHYCQCTNGAFNLFNNPAFVCINQCNLGGDCHNLGLGQSPPPPSTSNGSPPPSGGRNEAPYSLKKVPIVLLAVLTSTLFMGI